MAGYVPTAMEGYATGVQCPGLMSGRATRRDDARSTDLVTTSHVDRARELSHTMHGSPPGAPPPGTANHRDRLVSPRPGTASNAS